MTGPLANDYSLTPVEAQGLQAVVLLPMPERLEALMRLMHGESRTGVGRLFAEFIGLANSVAANCKTMAVEVLVEKGLEYPHQAEQLNTPSIFGALAGVQLAARVKEKPTCGSCAYRLGTPANQSECTTADAKYAEEDNRNFMCHESIDERGQCQTMCKGFAQIRKEK